MTQGTESRKRDHLQLALTEAVGSASLTTGFEHVQLAARALPELHLDEVDTTVRRWGRLLRAPLLISCMTGGVGEAGPINRALAAAAQQHRVAFGLGSGRAILEDPTAVASFRVRDLAPDVLLLANLGAAQLATYPPQRCRDLVHACEADVLVVHLNPVQEAVQPEGDKDFSGVVGRIARLVDSLDVPVVVKEVGFGLAPQDVTALVEAGVAGIDVAGAGGTNWARIEGLRDERAGAVAEAFADWGWPTARAIVEARRVLDESRTDVLLIGSGGLAHGVDAVKALCLGADLAGLARGLLAAAAQGPEAAGTTVGVLVEQLRIAVWATGAASLADLGPHRIIGEMSSDR